MAKQEEEEHDTAAETIAPSLPPSRVKKITKLDKEINKVNAEALFLVSCCTELAEESAQVAVEKKRRTVKLEHLRVAVKRPTSDFLLESLPVASEPVVDPRKAVERNRGGTHRIDDFFRKDS
ncbi:DNA polymerase epsilon subunit C-like [Rhododendron vialii]|uniref:DNA polymerase epsilon subunit C-like n=1 Tax=Rhododendron vialii TaxID=182163 RepID=UPI00265FB231|nr:DNA polymerase epsilon subunit C-like [Rhododendron vialii]